MHRSFVASANAFNGVTIMPVPGNWTLHYDWNSTGTYGSTPMTIAPNNTWTNGQGYHGPWVQVAGILTFQFDSSKTTYSGNLADKSVTGINTTFGGLNGSFYMLEAGAAAAQVAERAHAIADTSGKKR
jgi:hypothetical protein